MNKRIFGLLVVILVASFLFTACERSATGSGTAIPTSSGEVPFPAATEPQIMVDILKSTQTAAALTAEAGEGPKENPTSTPAFVFNTPENLPTATLEGSPTPEMTPTPDLTATAAPTATATMFAYPTPTPGKPAAYTLQRGEYPYCIARRFDVNPFDLLALNGLNAYSITYEGMVLTLPTSGTFPWDRALLPHPTTYTVKAGDSMGSIACSFGDADPNTIYAANGLANGAVLVVGQVINIP